MYIVPGPDPADGLCPAGPRGDLHLRGQQDRRHQPHNHLRAVHGPYVGGVEVSTDPGILQGPTHILYNRWGQK